MNCARFTNAGRVTNYEMTELREQNVWRNTCWKHVWASLADTFHPRSREEWGQHQERDDE